MWVPSLGQEDPLEEEMSIYSHILAWKNPMDRGACWATVHGVAKSWTRLSTHTFSLLTTLTSVIRGRCGSLR